MHEVFAEGRLFVCIHNALLFFLFPCFACIPNLRSLQRAVSKRVHDLRHIERYCVPRCTFLRALR